MTNNINFVLSTINLLRKAGIETVVFGGWAEELASVIVPREHKDLDLLYFSNDFAKVDKFIKSSVEVKEIKEKQFSHKRAFIFKGIMVEILLVQKNNNSYFTNFWNEYILEWPLLICKTLNFSKKQSIQIIQPGVINFYRNHQSNISAIRKKMFGGKIAIRA